MSKPKLIEYEGQQLTPLNLNPKDTPAGYWKGQTYAGHHGDDMAKHVSGSTPPWITDGFLLFGHKKNAYNINAAGVWGLDVGKDLDIIRSVADFYLLDAISAQVPQGKVFVPQFDNDTVLNLVLKGHYPLDRSDHEITSLMAMYLQALLVAKITPILRSYMYFACAGEAAHHPHLSGFLEPYNETAVRWFYRNLFDLVGGMYASKWLPPLFYNFKEMNDNGHTNWAGGWGGNKWGVCADVLHMFEVGRIGNQRFTAKNFCDRVFSLQHNGGTILNKLGWSKGLGGLNTVLDAHNNSDFRTLTKKGSGTVIDLWHFANKDEGFMFSGFNWQGTKYPKDDDPSPIKDTSITVDNGNYVEGCNCEQCQVYYNEAKKKAQTEAQVAATKPIVSQTPGQLQACKFCFGFGCDCVPPCDRCSEPDCDCCHSLRGFCNGGCYLRDCGCEEYSCDACRCDWCADCECTPCECCPECGSTSCCYTCDECCNVQCQCECCPSCDAYPCTCCPTCNTWNCNECDGCGEQDCECECCDDCGEHPCQCDDDTEEE